MQDYELDRWYTERDPKKEAAKAHDALRRIRRDDQRRQREDRLHYGLYSGNRVAGFTPVTYARLSLPEDRIRWNVARPVVDTAVAKIASKNPVRPMFLTSGGDWTTQQRAKKLEQFVEGAWYEGQARPIIVDVFRDGGVSGTGFIKVYPYRGCVTFERVFPSHLFVDHQEAMEGKPRTLYQVRYVPKDLLKALYPKQAAELDHIGEKPAEELLWWSTSYARTYLLEVVEAWHLPTPPPEGREASKRSDGRHVIFCEDVPLYGEEWKDEDFPFARFYWHRPVQGFFGDGAVKDIRDVQREINMTLMRVHESLRLHAVPKWIVERGANVEDAHLRGGASAIGDIVHWGPGGTPPISYTPAAMPKEVYDYLEKQYERAFELSGLSQMSATGVRPPVESGVARRVLHDIETERFATIVRQFEEFHLDLARLTIRCARRIAEEDASYRVRAPGQKFIDTIAWKEADLDEDAYVMQVWPASTLPQSPAGRFDMVMNWRNAGLVDDDQTKRLLGFPDTDREFALALAPSDAIDSILSDIVEHGRYRPPEAFLPLAAALKRAEQAYAKAYYIDRAPDERVALLRRFMRDVKTLMAKSPAAAGMPAANAGGVPDVASLASPPSPGLTSGANGVPSSLAA